MVTYHGRRSINEIGGLPAGCQIVFVDGDNGERLLPPRTDLRNHSPTGFEWGYGGSGPAQTALALCAHALGDDERALRVYQQFKFRVVGRMAAEWRLTRQEIVDIVASIESESEGADVQE